ncbi:hypothetical protein [Corynebacterium uterequi]|uniref:Secreted protein n=1 Tax=Corynebacterium uterequi TaxID=1072256 RepID=A0A0G3HDF2_9CORY|nr:hypothetical protein [Corynebacterium uterequi]AKK10720.1 hypothetical protein CUTER_03560 [Corynebacterium uterequi]
MKRFTMTAVLAASALALASCSSPDSRTEATSETTTTAAEKAHEGHSHDGHEHDAEQKEVSSLTPRVVLTHEGGITTIDSLSGEALDAVDEPGFYRLNHAGDGRHVMVTDSDVFRVYDSGNEAAKHEDHYHYYESAPHLKDTSYDAAKAGHVVHHEGLTALFSDATGDVTIVATDEIANPDAKTTTLSTGAAHHGVAVPFEDGSVLHTVGTEEERHTIRHVAADGTVLAETDNCPGVHGEAVADGEAVVFGCTNGPVVYRDGAFTKIAASGYQRNGNLAGSEDSPIVLGDNKTEKDAEFERPTSVVLIDSRDASLRTVELGSSYWFRSLARGPEGEAIVLTYDGELVIIDEETGEITNKIKVIEPWREKEEWQQPGPILKVAGTDAYVTDAANNTLVVVDLTSGEIALEHKLDFSPVEMAVATGRA